MIEETIRKIRPVERQWIERAAERQRQLTKPPGSLGLLEHAANRLAAIRRSLNPKLDRKRIYVAAGDHGVVEEGVSAYPREVTAQMALNFLRGGAAINVLARHAGVDVIVVDAGVDADFADGAELVQAKVRRGTANIARGPAMSRHEAIQTVVNGIDLSLEGSNQEVDLIGLGEMGIGNTTAAAAIASALTGAAPAVVTGYGTGVDEAGFQRKIRAVARALEINQPDSTDAIDILSKVGGLEIGFLMGLTLGAASQRIPVVADGFISTAAAALAVLICPAVRDYLFLAHRSQEKGHATLIEWIGHRPLLDLQLRLGEGTGAALAIQILAASAKLLGEMATFADAGVSDKGE